MNCPAPQRIKSDLVRSWKIRLVQFRPLERMKTRLGSIYKKKKEIKCLNWSELQKKVKSVSGTVMTWPSLTLMNCGLQLQLKSFLMKTSHVGLYNFVSPRGREWRSPCHISLLRPIIELHNVFSRKPLSFFTLHTGNGRQILKKIVEPFHLYI